MSLYELHCPNCFSEDIKFGYQYNTKNHGSRTMFLCKACRFSFSETKKSFFQGLKKPISLIWQVLNARTEGMGLNAAARVYGISKNTIIDWETKFTGLYKILFIYSITSSFLELITEGDEFYTKIRKNVPQEESAGWTIVLMDRASRFIWELTCGKKDRKLFKKAIKTMQILVNQTQDITLLTDGERRYGKFLFEVCHELIRTGKVGRPRKTLPKGVRVRVKNKGSQANKKGPKRPKYQAPLPEHPETVNTIENKEIHANHVEANNSAMRRKCSVFRRKTNTYAKSTTGLQRILNVYWVMHNFMRTHFTTRKVPALALGLLKKRLTPKELFSIQYA